MERGGRRPIVPRSVLTSPCASFPRRIRHAQTPPKPDLMRSTILLVLLVCAVPFAAKAQVLPIGTIGNVNNTSYVYPNPFDNVLNVALPTQQTSMCRVEFLNSQGDIVFSQVLPWTSVVSINTSSLPTNSVFNFRFYSDTQALLINQMVSKRRSTLRR